MSQILAGIFLIIVFETSKITGMKQDENNNNIRITHTVGFVTMLMGCVFNYIFFLLDSKFLANIINLCNFRL